MGPFASPPRSWQRLAIGAVAVAVTAAACGSGQRAQGPSPTAVAGSGSGGPAPSFTAPGSSGSPVPSLDVAVRLVRVASLDSPLAMAIRQDDPDLYIAEQGGRVFTLRSGGVDPTPVLDLSARISVGGERGLLGLAFSPDGRFLYASFTNENGDSEIDEFPFSGGRVVGAARRVLLVRQPFANHNGGGIAFGPDGYLYFGLGDGGSEGDPQDNGQSMTTLLGKMLRIDPRPSNGRPHGIPPGNPFVGRPGVPPETWASGLRNPWRFSFDRETGDLWIGDVGQNEWEEVDFQPASSRGGENYGWRRFEGTHRYDRSPVTGPVVPPVYEYSHQGGGCVVTGGYVYRGSAIPQLRGAYIFADFCMGRIMALRLVGGRVTGPRPLGVTVGSLASFGQDQQGELYALSLDGGVYRIAPAS
jgi:glucose/arabinose dehydrogenase